MIGRIGTAFALASVAALVLVGCTPEEPVETSPPPSPTASATTDEAELAAMARESWDLYRERMSSFGADPNMATLELLKEVAAPATAASLLENFEEAAERRIHTEGTRRTTAFRLADTSDAPATLSVQVCVDLSQERYIGDEGVDLTPSDRPDERASVVDFVLDGDSDRYLIAGETEISATGTDNPCS